MLSAFNVTTIIIIRAFPSTSLYKVILTAGSVAGKKFLLGDMLQ